MSGNAAQLYCCKAIDGFMHTPSDTECDHVDSGL